MWKGAAHPVKHIADIGDIVVVDRRIEIDPEQIRRRYSCSNVIGETERATLQALRQQSVEAGLEQWRLAGIELGRRRQCLRETNRRNATRREARRRHGTEMPQAIDANRHVRASTTQGFAIRYSS